MDVGPILGRFVAIDAGYDHTCALTEEGEVWCWGDYAFGQLKLQVGGVDLQGRPDVTPDFIAWYHGEPRPFDPLALW